MSSENVAINTPINCMEEVKLIMYRYLEYLVHWKFCYFT